MVMKITQIYTVLQSYFKTYTDISETWDLPVNDSKICLGQEMVDLIHYSYSTNILQQYWQSIHNGSLYGVNELDGENINQSMDGTTIKSNK